MPLPASYYDNQTDRSVFFAGWSKTASKEAAVIDAQRLVERYLISCRRCRATWEEEYEVVQYSLSHEDPEELFFRGGQLCTPPWIRRPCPQCGDYRVHALPVTRRFVQSPNGRHPEPDGNAASPQA